MVIFHNLVTIIAGVMVEEQDDHQNSSELCPAPAPDQAILVPFIGAFSSGKSSLINALLGEALLSTDITPETALPVELRGGPVQSTTVRWPEGTSDEMSAEYFAKANFSETAYRDARLELRLPQLQRWPNLVMVDLPGWSSGRSEHERHIDEYLLHLGRTHLDSKTLYVIAVSADEGTLRDNLRERLQQLDLGNASYLVALTKADKRSAADLQSVSTHVAHMLTATLGKPPNRVISTSARKRDIDSLREALDATQTAIDQQGKKLAEKTFLLRHIEKYLAEIENIRKDLPGLRRDIVDDWMDDFTWNVLDSSFDYVPHFVAHVHAEGVQIDLTRSYTRIFNEKLSRRMPEHTDEFISGLTASALKIPEYPNMGQTKEYLLKKLKRTMQPAIARAKPGIVASSDPEAVGRRMKSKCLDLKKEFRADFFDALSCHLDDWLETQTREWQQLRRLVSQQ